jgi:hypothetical protein
MVLITTTEGGRLGEEAERRGACGSAPLCVVNVMLLPRCGPHHSILMTQLNELDTLPASSLAKEFARQVFEV